MSHWHQKKEQEGYLENKKSKKQKKRGIFIGKENRLKWDKARRKRGSNKPVNHNVWNIRKRNLSIADIFPETVSGLR